MTMTQRKSLARRCTMLTTAALTGFWLAVAGVSPACAQLVVDVTEANARPLPIAISDFNGPQGAAIAAVVRDNLERSGLFDVQNPDAFLQRDVGVSTAPRFADWRVINSAALVVGSGAMNGTRLRVEFRMWDVLGESQMLGLEFSSTDENWRRIAHKISDAIYQRLTGLPGNFDTRLVFIAESGSRTNRVKRLAVMDQDGGAPTYLTTGPDQILTPRFSPSGQQLVYTALSDTGIRLYVLDTETGRQELIPGLSNMVFAPRFSPDGQSIIFSADRDGNTEVLLRNLRTGQMRQLTDHPAIDTSPDIAPDGSSIVFTSDRGGGTQIYRMGMDGSNPERLTFGEGRYSTPVWSPNGRQIAFTRQSGGAFQIGVMNADGSGERILTSAWLVEGPSWSPNGRTLLFQREDGPGGEAQLWSIDVSGRNLRRAPYPSGASDPSWSPTLD
jgi:TolB protein